MGHDHIKRECFQYKNVSKSVYFFVNEFSFAIITTVFLDAGLPNDFPPHDLLDNRLRQIILTRTNIIMLLLFASFHH
jgi:hypothetical protein